MKIGIENKSKSFNRGWSDALGGKKERRYPAKIGYVAREYHEGYDECLLYLARVNSPLMATRTFKKLKSLLSLTRVKVAKRQIRDREPKPRKIRDREPKAAKPVVPAKPVKDKSRNKIGSVEHRIKWVTVMREKGARRNRALFMYDTARELCKRKVGLKDVPATFSQIVDELLLREAQQHIRSKRLSKLVASVAWDRNASPTELLGTHPKHCVIRNHYSDLRDGEYLTNKLGRALEEHAGISPDVMSVGKEGDLFVMADSGELSKLLTKIHRTVSLVWLNGLPVSVTLCVTAPDKHMIETLFGEDCDLFFSKEVAYVCPTVDLDLPHLVQRADTAKWLEDSCSLAIHFGAYDPRNGTLESVLTVEE